MSIQLNQRVYTMTELFKKKSPAASAPKRDKAPAWLNIAINDAEGNPHKIGGIPLSLDNDIHKLIMSAAEELGLEDFNAALNEGKIVVELNPVRDNSAVKLF